MDILTPAQRSERMKRIKGKNTKPELIVRRLAHQLGYRFRIHRQDLPGSPDLVFSSRRKVIFVHGCFWHFHFRCKIAHIPKSRQEYWLDKFAKNRARDARNKQNLKRDGWKILTLWECEIHSAKNLEEKIIKHLGPASKGKINHG